MNRRAPVSINSTIGQVNVRWSNRFRALEVHWSDLALVLVVIILVIVGSISGHTDSADQPIDGLAIALGIIGALSLAVSRRFPQVMIGVAATVIFAYLARGYPGGPALLVGPLSMALAGYRASRTVALVGATIMSAAVITGQWIGEGHLGTIAIAGPAWAFTLALAGILLSARTERAAAQRERDEMRRRQAMTDERLNIARDLHDSVAHALATINVQAGVAAHLLDRQPHQAKAALEAIRQASSEVLDELGTMLETLRDHDQGAPRSPTATLGQVPGLIERARADGLTVNYHPEGDVDAVSSSMSTAAFRVIQESLNNVRRHAGTAPVVEISVVADPPHRLAVSVSDDGGRPDGTKAVAPEPGTGLGIIGMTERVESSRGTIEVGPKSSGGGYRVIARWGQGTPA
ncbi:UNVERIFIED_CONTAM: signal transduction histidine kinase [Williamsia faeni]